METPDSFASSYPLEILIADDDVIRRTATKKQLIQLGYMPEEAASDSEVLAMTETRRYDVILMEVLIPGIKVILDNARQEANQKPLFIAISGSRSREKEGMSLSPRIDSVLTRPMDRPEFLLQLKACSVLAGKCAIRSGR